MTMLCPRCGDIIYKNFVFLCPACVRIERLYEDQKYEEYERQRKEQIREEKYWAKNAAMFAKDCGYQMDENVADYHLILNEDGSLNWNCTVKDRCANYPDLVGLIKEGFFKRLKEAKPVGAQFKYILDSAYWAGQNGLFDSFYIPHETKGLTFYLNLEPEVEFDLDSDGNLTWIRNEIFDDADLMTAYDQGVQEYIENNTEALKNQVLENREHAAREKAQRKTWEAQETNYAWAKFGVLLYIALTIMILVITGYSLFATLLCAGSAVFLWLDKDGHDHPLLYVTIVYTLILIGSMKIADWISAF